jgi:replicative DNA helicase
VPLSVRLPPAAPRAAVCLGAARPGFAVLQRASGGTAGDSSVSDLGSIKDEAARMLAEAQANRPWVEPVPLRPVIDLPGFPVEALPDWLAAYVAAEAVATQTPPDLPGMLALAALATAAGGLARIQVRPGWQEPLNLFVVVALPPGSRKSAVFADLTRPLVRLDRDELARMRPLIVEAMTKKTAAEKNASKAIERVAAAKTEDPAAELANAIQAQAEAEAIMVPPLPRLLADDTTAEALASLMADQGGRIALLSAEGGPFDAMAGRYQGGGIYLDPYLKGHAGDELRVDRKGRAAEYVAQPALTVGLAVQPDVLRKLTGHPGFRGRGLLARFLYALPANTVGSRQIAPPPVPEAVAERYRVDLYTLARSLLDEREAAKLAGNTADPIILTLTTPAAVRLTEYEVEVEPRLHPHHGDLAHVADWASKLVGAVARIGGLLHLAARLREGWGLPVNEATITDAIRIGRYLTDHALATFDLMGGADPTLEDARYLLAWIERTGSTTFTRRELFTALPRGRFAKVDALDLSLELLVEHGYICPLLLPERPSGPGRPASPSFEVNPLWRR